MESKENESDTVKLQQSMLSALQTLDPTRRHLVIAAYLYGESRQRLAEQYGVPVNTIKTWLRRALLQVRAQIGAMALGDLALLVDGIREQQLEDRVGSEIEIGLL